jgi:hypothetical protein
MASSSNDKEKMPSDDDRQDLKLKEGHVSGGSRARDPTFVEGLLVTDKLCAQYRVLERKYRYFKKRILGFAGC